MDPSILRLIEKAYCVQIQRVADAPRQFVAETFVITLKNATRYFVKLIKYTKYAENTIKSLPVLIDLHKMGLSYINYPITTSRGQLYLIHDNTLVILFNFIDGKQTFDFDYKKLGKLIAEVHQMTPKVTADITKELFEPLYLEDLPKFLDLALNEANTEEVEQQLRSYLNAYEPEIRQDWKRFHKLLKQCKSEKNTDYRLTHGDAVGNVMKSSRDELFIIDWDEIKLAPAERDTWFLIDNHQFLAGYCELIPDYKLNKLAYSFYIHNRYWEDLLGFIEEIFNTESIEHKRKNFEGLKKDCTGWLRPLLRSLD